MNQRSFTLVAAGLACALGAVAAQAGDGCGKKSGYGSTSHWSAMSDPDRWAYRPGLAYAPAVYYAMPNHPAVFGGPHGQARMIKTGMQKEATRAGSGDIVEVASNAGSFETLVAAVQAAGLVDTLKGDGPFTVFAPTDEAFAKIPKDQLDALLADKSALTKVLTYHVVPGRVLAADVSKVTTARTVEGGNLSIDTTDGVKVDGARVVETDILASNGVIHVIDTVILPN
jgi:uncharacterized surface protein with fasciclin (FAS1) repeats